MIDVTPDELEQQWRAFRKRWPVEALQQLTLDKYHDKKSTDSFSHWLEGPTGEIGSQQAYSPVKFGVFKRWLDKAPSDTSSLLFSETHRWVARYGNTAADAFQVIQQQINKVVAAAQAGDLESIEKTDLSDSLSWKLAFLYQNPDSPCIVPILSSTHLFALCDSTVKTTAEAHRHLLAARREQPLFEYACNLWKYIEATLDKPLSTKQALGYLQQSENFRAIKEPTKYLAGFMSDEGLQLALSVDTEKVSLYLTPGDWQTVASKIFSKPDTYSKDTPRNSNLAANAPALALGNECVKVTVGTLDDLIQLCHIYTGQEVPSSTHTTGHTKGSKLRSQLPHAPLNQILFGPPGTGKTFTTTYKAVSIADPDWTANIYEALPATEQRAALTARYQALVEEQRIVFTTFHQSFSYEDFVEGIRANTSEHGAGLSYDIEPGVFKQIAEHANKAVGAQPVAELSDAPTVWKISIGRSDQTTLRQACLDAGEARIGWSEAGDLSEDYDERSAEQQAYWDGLSNKNHSALNGFSEDMAVGDVLLCLKDLETVQAVGIVTSDYHYDESGIDEGQRYAHVRKVNWLLSDIELSILPINQQHKLGRQTLHQLERISWEDLLAELHKQGYSLPASETQPSAAKPNHVLIIDEINRGNTSRIFGELITLLEDDKRKGASDEKSIKLPYSKERFSVPSNLYLIGTMNTADKSLAQMDLALRRRFSFVETPPQPELLRDTDVHRVNMADLLLTINQRIEVLLDAEHTIGHAYFMPLIALDDEASRQKMLASIFKDKIIPLLQEYFFDDYERIGWVLNDPAKPAEHRFIQQAKAAKLPKLSELFPAEVAEQIGDHAGDRRHRINADAFNSPEAYRGIVGTLDKGEKQGAPTAPSQAT